MTKFSKAYCLGSVLLSIAFIVHDIAYLSGISTDPYMLIVGFFGVIWLPISVIAIIPFWINRKVSLAWVAAFYAIYVIVNFLSTPEIASKETLMITAKVGLLFSVIFGALNAWFLKRLTGQQLLPGGAKKP